jgi:putative transposase
MTGDGGMIKSIKIRILPTKEQEKLMFKTINICRFAYNWGLNYSNEYYKEYKKSISGRKICKEFTKLKKLEEYSWLKEVSSQAIISEFENLDNAFKRFFKKICKYPKFKSKKKSKQNFYVRYDSMNIKNNTVNIEKIGRVKFKTNYKIPILDKYMNPTCSFDGKYWYLSFGFEHENQVIELNKELSIGIDLGIKELAVVSNLEKPIKNINKSKKVCSIKKRIKKLQRQISRKYEMNKQDGKFIKTNNIIKLEKQVKLLFRKLTNIKQNHIHQATSMIVKMFPYRIVMEDLNIKGMTKNRHLSKAISECKFYEFIRQVKYKSEYYGIEFVQVPKFYPSSKTCSCCGKIKNDLKLSDRIYKCDCGLEIDRDKNASYNLANYNK